VKLGVPGSRRRLTVAGLVVSAAVALPFASFGHASTAAAGPTANLWVDPDGGSCNRQARPAGYESGRACGSLQAAANAAAPNDVVLVRDGTYGGQKLSGSKPVTFRGSGPGRPSFGQIIQAASHQKLQHLLVENRDDQPVPGCGQFVLDYTLFVCGADDTFDDVVVDALHHTAGDPARKGGLEVTDGATGLVFRNGEIRGVTDSKGFQGGAAEMLIENTVFHDITLTSAGAAVGVHNECAYITGGNGQTWRRNTFSLCPIMAMFFANFIGGPPFSNVTIENNVFTHSLNDGGSWHDGSSFVIPNGAGGQNQVNGWVIRYNTFEVSPDIESTPGTGDDNGSARYYGNLGADGDCKAPEWTYSYNVGTTCGGTGEVNVPRATNDRGHPNQAPFYVDAAKGDFHLRAGTPAVNHGDRERFPTVDADGSNRPLAAVPDAGAYEYGTGLLAVGGLGSGSDAQRRAASAMRDFERKNAANLLVTLGDNDSTNGRAFARSWRSAFSWLSGARVRVAGALGPRDVDVRRGRYQFATLAMPGPYYVRRLRDAEVVVLDASAVTDQQTAWLQQTLARPTNLYRIVVLGHSPYACGDSGQDAAIRTKWVPLFARNGVHLVLSGNDPAYQRYTIGGVTYVSGTVGGATSARPCLTGSASRRTTRRAPAFVYVVAGSGGATVQAVDLSGKTIDSFRVR
jgi:hypothetical protein